MTVNELIEQLEEYRENHENGGEHDVRWMGQPNYPFEYSIAGTFGLEHLHDIQGEDRAFQPADKYGTHNNAEGPIACCYLVEGQQLGYGTRDAWNL